MIHKLYMVESGTKGLIAVVALVVGLTFVPSASAQDGVAPRTLVLPKKKALAPSSNAPKPSEKSAPAEGATESASENQEFRSISLLAESADITSPVTPNTWVMDKVNVHKLPSAPIPEPIILEEGVEPGTHQCFSDADCKSLWWSEPMIYDFLPDQRLWVPPLANQREPRTYGKFTNLNDESTIETAIGHTFGIARFGPESNPNEGFQLNGMAAVFTRFNEQRFLVTSDFRAGVPVTYAKGPWSAKISYEHTSTHIGDEFFQSTGRRQVPHVRDEVVFGLAYRFYERIRLYGQFGYSIGTSDLVGEDRDRYDFGLEWDPVWPTRWWGRPTAAIDFDIRSDQDYQVNLTAQAGWQLKSCHGHTGRIVVEYYNGRSPYGQFFRDYEDWVGVAFNYDY